MCTRSYRVRLCTCTLRSTNRSSCSSRSRKPPGHRDRCLHTDRPAIPTGRRQFAKPETKSLERMYCRPVTYQCKSTCPSGRRGTRPLYTWLRSKHSLKVHKPCHSHTGTSGCKCTHPCSRSCKCSCCSSSRVLHHADTDTLVVSRATSSFRHNHSPLCLRRVKQR